MLFFFTLLVNYIALAIAIWLGVYLITHGSRRLLSILTALTLWAIGGVFLNIVLALSNPILPDELPIFFQYLFPFWNQISNSGISTAWLQGWSVAPAIGFWHHATVLFRPGEISRWRSTRIFAGYLVGAGAIVAQSKNEILVPVEGGNPLYLTSLRAGPLFALFLTLLLFFTVWCLINLSRSARHATSRFQRKSLETLIVATLVAGSTTPIMIGSSILNFDMPIIVQSILLGIATVMMGFSVMRYGSVTIERIIRRDFLYNALAASFMVSIFLGIAWIAVTFFGISSIAYPAMLILAVMSFATVDSARRYLDSVFYKAETRQIINNLKQLADVAINDDMNHQLKDAITSIALLVKATSGVLITTGSTLIEEISTYKRRFSNKSEQLGGESFFYDDTIALEKGTLPDPYTDIVLLIPLYDAAIQIGALLLARPENGESYAPEDLEHLMHPTDQLGHLLALATTRQAFIAQVPQILNSVDVNLQANLDIEPISAKSVEDALRHLHDFAYLGNMEMSTLAIVDEEMPTGKITHIDRGKSLNKVLLMAMEKLKPDGELTEEPPPRLWHAYKILHDAYVNDQKNMDIMSNLYISQGTFNRTRRTAIRSLTQALREMEAIK